MHIFRQKAKEIVGWTVFVLLCLGCFVPPGDAQAKAIKTMRPIVFVHGGAGSANNFQTQFMRFASNGYPTKYLTAHEYDSTLALNTFEQIYDALDQTITTVLQATGADRVDLVGHSMGTRVSQGYLATASRAAKVAHYVNIDGYPAAAPPGGVPTLAIWAGMGWTAETPGREITGAVNVLMPNQTHVDAATSPESFAQMFKFFTGQDPVTTDVVMEPPGRIYLYGRAVQFPLNIGIGAGAMLEIWEVHGSSGARRCHKPEAVYLLDAGGHWGPFKAKSGVHYEFNLVRAGMESHHYYFQPFERSNYWMRLLASSPTYGGASAYMDRSAAHSNVVILRNKEFWGDQGAQNDILTVNGVNIVNAATSPVKKGIYRTGVTGFYIFDKGADGVTDLSAPVPYFFAQSFASGVDVFLPARTAPDASISALLMSRGGCGAVQVIHFPNWASATDRVTIQFNDYVDSRCGEKWPPHQHPGRDCRR
jgi:pimeloyl-ACP methyl ester carboxylesterase